MSHRRVELRIPVSDVVPLPGPLEIAAAVYFPAAAATLKRHCVLFAVPGAGYGRGYFDITVSGFEGYSQAEYHACEGVIFVAVDHLGVGDSSIPDLSQLTLPIVAAANDAAVREVCSRLHGGTLDPELPPLPEFISVGIGQSMGGFVIVSMQANHCTFDAIGVLGVNMVHIHMPVRPGLPPVAIPHSADHAQVASVLSSGVDWRYAFHWEDEPAALVDADLEGGLPVRVTTPPWGSLTVPQCASTLVMQGVLAGDAARVDVPILLAMGERDVCKDPVSELSAFPLARDLALYVIPRMVHMHNFASTRARMWRRIEMFLRQTRSHRDEALQARG